MWAGYSDRIQEQARSLCYDSFLSWRYFKNAEMNYKQLKEALGDLPSLGNVYVSHPAKPDAPIDYEAIKQALMVGFIMNIARYDPEAETYRPLLLAPDQTTSKIDIDKRSTMARSGDYTLDNNELARPNLILYGHLCEGPFHRGVQELSMQTCTTLDNIPFGNFPDPAFYWSNKFELITVPHPSLRQKPQ